MALKDVLDQNFTNSVLKKTFIGAASSRQVAANNDDVIVSQDSIVKISNSLTSLENAFNKIYAYSLNVRNLQQFQEKRLQTIKRETGLESKISGPGAAATNIVSDTTSGTTTTVDKLNELTTKIEKLNEKIAGLDSGGGGGDLLTTGAAALGFTKLGSRLAGPVAILLDIAMRSSEGESAGQIAAGVGGGAAGAYGGAALGTMIAPGIGTAIGGIGGYIAGSFLGDTAYDTIQARASGGPVRAGGTYIVGERGPEVVTFNGVSGRVTPNGQRGKPPAAEKYLMSAAEQSVRAKAKLERERPLTTTSYSSKLSNYLSSLFSSIPNWVQNIRKFFQPTQNTPLGTLGGGRYTPLGDLSGVTGDWARDQEFLAAVDRVAQKWDIDPGDLLGLMYHESAGTMSPSVQGSNGATGLFQFMPAFFPTQELARMTRAQQVDYADANIFSKSGMPRNANAGQLYAAVYLPGIARQQGYQGVLTRQGEAYYNQNPSLDPNNDGQIDIYDLATVISNSRNRLGLGASPSLSMIGTNPSSQGFISPTGRALNITSGFGMRTHPILGDRRHHAGIDIAGNTGDPVTPVKRGRVTFAGDGGSYGNVIYIDHGNGLETRYAHLSRINITRGEVNPGDVIGLIGSTGRSTGPHLHFEVLVNGQKQDPTPYLQGITPVQITPRQAPPIIIDTQRRMSINPALVQPSPFRPGISQIPQGPMSRAPAASNPAAGSNDFSGYFYPNFGPLKR